MMSELVPNHSGGGAAGTDVWNLLPEWKICVGHVCVFLNNDVTSTCVEGGLDHPWFVGKVVELLDDDEVLIHEYCSAALLKAFSSKGSHIPWYKGTEAKINANDVMIVRRIDYFSKKPPSMNHACCFQPHVRTVSVDALLFWGSRESVLTNSGSLRHNPVLKSLSSNSKVLWSLRAD